MILPMAEIVIKLVTLVLQGIESLVLYLPTLKPTFVGRNLTKMKA